MGDSVGSSRRGLVVYHLGKYYPPAPGGIETHVRTLARAQAQLGLDVTVLCVNHLNRSGSDATWARYGATSTRYDVDELGVKIIRAGRSMAVARMDVCPMLPRIVRNLNRRPPDLWHLHTPNVTMLLTVAALTSSNVPLVITHHSDIVRQRWLRLALGPYERRVYERATAILTSAWEYAGGSELLSRHTRKLEVLPMGLDLKPYNDPEPAVKCEEARIRERFGSPLWLAVGRCVYYKGLHTAIEALRHVPGRLLIVGEGPLRETLMRLAERLGVASRVSWWDHTNDIELRAAYRAADALWFPSNARSEAFGLVQVEAMASGCPVINTDIPHSGVAWVSRHEQTGLTVPMDNPRALAAAARRLLDEPGLRQRLSAGAMQRAELEFRHETMARRSVEIYQRLLAAHREVPTPANVQLAAWVRNMGRPTNAA